MTQYIVILESKGDDMKKVLLFLVVLLTLGYANAATDFDDMREDVLIRPLPEVTLQEKLKPIELKTLNVDTKIIGNIAQSTYEMAFYNPNKRILEGELKLPLLDGQSIVEYALEVNGEYRVSSVVEKAKAKKAYENTIRQNIDPGIIEKTLGNNYKLRLYPLPSQGFKKLKVTVEEILTSKADNYLYSVPFVSRKKIENFKLHIEIVSSEPVITKLYGSVEDRVFDTSEQGSYFTYKKTDMRLKKPIVLALKKSTDAKVFFQKNRKGKKNWFMAVVPKEHYLERRGIAGGKTEHIEIIWDTSLSSESRDISKELGFLEHFFAKNSQTSYTVALKTIDIHMHNHGTYKVANAEWKKLKSKLKSLQYNGAKDLSKLAVGKKAKRVLFFSNGINSFSDRVRAMKKIPVVTINSSVGADISNLKYIAQTSGGKYIDLLQLSLKDAIRKLYAKDGCRIKRTSSNIYDTYVKDAGDSVVILGRIKGVKGTVQYTLGALDHQINIEKKTASRLLSRVWASSKIDHLSLRYKKNRAKIIALAKWYKIVTKDMSLIVLDRVEDYVRYEIVPPKSLQKRYYAQLKEIKKEKRSEKRRAIEESIALLKDQKEWYRTKFPLKKTKSEYEDTGEEGGDIAPVEAVMDPSVEVPAPARVMAKKSKKKKKSSTAANAMTIKLKGWSSNASYITALKGVPKSELLGHYFASKKEHKSEPSFYVDMSDYFYKKGLKKEALVILSNLLELDFEKSEFIRVFAFKLLEHNQNSTSIFFFQKVRELRPFELQSTRDLALAYERTRKYQKALDLHYEIISKIWDSRFSGAKIVSINELNHLISKHKLNLSKIDRRLISHMPVDVRIVINWSTDNTDMDLWVIDPKDEKTYYGNRTSRIGGKISNDMTRGYGPEEFMIKKAIRGKYAIKVKYFGSSQQKLTGPTVIRAEVYTKYGKRNEQRQEIVFRVEEEKEVIDLGEISY